MNIPTPHEIKKKRENLGLRQADLANMAGISQSMIARIESGTVDPRASTLRKVINVLEKVERPKVIAADVMCTPVYTVLTTDPISKALGLMQNHGISQLPVLESGFPVGSISETVIINAIENKNQPRPQTHSLKEYLEPGFPTIPSDTDLTTVVNILQNNHAVLVVDKGQIKGVITKHDLISLIS